MCRCPDFNAASSFYAPSWRPSGTAGSDDGHGKRGLRIRSFQLQLFTTVPALSSPESQPVHLPGTITLVYYPREGGAFEINGCKARPGAPSFLSLYRVQSVQLGAAVFACTDRVWAAEGARFEAYVGEEKAVSGVLRRTEDGVGGGAWEMECRCGAFRGLCGVEVTVVGERGVVLREKVEVAKSRGKLRRRGCGGRGRFCSRLEGIPEEEESESEDGESVSSSTEAESCCSCCGGSSDEEWEVMSGSEGSAEEVVEAEVEGVGWAVDVGIWVMCIGVGFLVSKASSAYSLNRRWRTKGVLFR